LSLTDHFDSATRTIFKLLETPLEYQYDVSVSMLDLLRGIERLGGVKGYQNFIADSKSTNPATADKGISIRFTHSSSGWFKGWTAFIYTDITISANLDGVDYKYSGGAWGFGGGITKLYHFPILSLLSPQQC
jgi:hypothetical protein